MFQRQLVHFAARVIVFQPPVKMIRRDDYRQRLSNPKKFRWRQRGVKTPLWLEPNNVNVSPRQNIMNSTSLFSLGPFQQGVLAAMVFPPQLLLTEKCPVAEKFGSPDKPAELITDFEDHRNHGIGD